MNSVLVMSPHNPNNVKVKGTLGQINDKEYLNPKNNGDTASFAISPGNFTNEYNNQENKNIASKAR